MFHPYKLFPAKAFWPRSVAALSMSEVDPVGVFDLKITKDMKIATAGSCFAQHIARYIQESGFCYYVAETGHPILPEEVKIKHNYGLFSARYGNIYTACQLLQLLRRAYGKFLPEDDCWIEDNGQILDPFRPTTQPGGFISEAEMRADRAQHLAAVREMFENCNVFVFTLGLTECWVSKKDGAVFPLCPGVAGGIFDKNKYDFYNQTVEDVIADMSKFIDSMQELNPQAQIMLTVSPVPLMATAEDGAHVLSATTYSKSVLRVAAEVLRKRYSHVHYFPSYEIITGIFNRGMYYGADLRSITEQGVSHVMKLFLKHAAGITQNDSIASTDVIKKITIEDTIISLASKIVQAECDEELLGK